MFSFANFVGGIKMFDTSCPVGPFVPKDNVKQPHNLGTRFLINSIMIILI